MDRREAIRNVTLLFGGAITASTFSVLFEGCTNTEKKAGNEALFSPEQQAVITEMADIIIPQTSSPGAKAAGVGPFIAMMLEECYPEDVQKLFSEGLTKVDQMSKDQFKSSFVNLDVEKRNAVVRKLADDTIAERKADKEKEKAAEEKNAAKKNPQDKAPGKTYFFALIRELTLLGYFTSEVGAKESLAYLPIPGRWDACTDLKPDQKAWAL